ncbi:B12-binding domain-containing radical SAM protein [Thiovibrio frasassiensis]|uniref:B12-binding domain-containing radical SAM protein n=1 Tax=Thiovibrio frasassiensis TaxID=2984131 RepID=A0A9X4ML56_9BACT|nr:radical SAM protein [Thiovibrio frasassiensis]MDG4474797.1 B12-binding domain-containing radical SAM protein [Thiovibrio frasassiensis]
MKEIKNILLVNGFSSPTKIINELLVNQGSDSNIYLSYPLGIMTLGAWCRQKFPGFRIQIVDASMDLHKHISDPNKEPIELNKFIEIMLGNVDFIPDFIGISFSFSNGHKSCLQLSNICKDKWPTSKIIAGGVHATTFTRGLITDPSIDFVVRGPGDLSFLILLECLMEGKNPAQIPGVVTGIDNVASMAPTLTNLDTIPPYPYDLIDMEYLVVNESTAPTYEEGTRTGMIFMSRGCPFGCSFCSADKVHGRKVSFFSVDRIVAEIEYLITTFQVNTISILDDLFGADKQYFRDFFSKIEERNLSFRLVVPGGLSIAVFDEKMIDILIAHGLTAVYFPIESGSKHVQDKIIKKRVDLDKAVRLVSYSKQKGLFTGINIILGFPGETKEMMHETYKFISDLSVDWIAFFAAYPYPETEMTNILLSRGTLTQDDLVNIWDSSTQGFKKRPFDTEEISGQDLSDLIYDMNIKLNFFLNYNLRMKNYAHVIPKLNKLIDRYPFHVIALACRSKCFHELGRYEDALDDVAEIKGLVLENRESARLFERYRESILETIGSYELAL